MKSNKIVFLIGGIILVIGVIAIIVANNYDKNKDMENEEDLYIAAEKWNTLIDMWADGDLNGPINDLLTYDAEINNGGHLQFFENCNEDLDVMMESLKGILSKKLYDNLNDAYRIYLSSDYNIENVNDYVDVALEGNYDMHDDVYYDSYKEIRKIIQEYANKIELD